MSDNLSKKIVRDTFEKSFDKEQFTLFIKNLLNRIDDSEEATFTYSGQLIPEVYRDSISSLERIGKYTDPEGKKIELLIVNLKKENSLDRARTLQRNFVAWYLDGSRGGIFKDAALVAFVSPDLHSWRFSLVKMDYKIQEAKVKKDLTPAKRYSFLVGSQEKSHTAQSRLVPIIEDDVNYPTLKQLEEAFNIEKVTKEFFEKYRELFIGLKESLDEIVSKNKKIKDDFDKNNIDTTSFAKKLLGQIVFLYFLQKKGWFGVERDSDWGTGPKDFLRELFDKKKVKYENFFNDVLEPLFYEALAKKRDKDFYNHLNCKIPFLNGGLFDPINDYDWVYTDININNDLFSNEFKTKEGDIGTGILDVFDRYNFTVREDEPLEKEVAVDPEMLGKVFENLLEVKDRKSKGTYYTPREIVHYMCQESLINYLHSELTELGHDISKEDLSILVKKGASFIHNDQSAISGKKRYEEQIPKSIKKLAPLIDLKLADIKVCDPAVGSGAFLVGMMNQIVSCREVLWSLLNDTRERDTYKFKSGAIQHSLYGVDIDPSAVEVAKLRLWLSLVVEEDDIKKIKPLPNLDYKIMQGNSLLEEFKGVKLFDEKLLTKSKVVEYDYVAELKQKELELGGKLLPYYQKNPSWMNNRSISRPPELAEIEMEMDRIKASLKKNNSKTKELIIKPLQVGLNFLGSIGKEDVWLKLKKLYGIYFKSYDIDKKKKIRNSIEKVIWELIETTIRDKGKLDTLKEIEVYRNNGIRPFFLWKLYFADVFQEKGGFDVVIANPPYVRISGISEDEDQQIRNNFKTVFGHYDIYIPFFEKGQDLLKKNGTLAFITPNKYLTKRYGNKLRPLMLRDTNLLKFIDTSQATTFDSASVYPVITILSKSSVSSETYVAIIDDNSFQDFFQFGTSDFYFIKQSEFGKNKNTVFDIFVDKSSRTLFQKIEKDTIPLGDYSKILTGTPAINIFYKWDKLLKSEKEIKPKEVALKFINVSNVKPYKIEWGKEVRAVGKRFNNPYLIYDDKLVGKNKWSVFCKKKIVIKGTAKRLTASIDSVGYANLSLYAVIFNEDQDNLKKNIYHLCLLNSKLLNYWYCKKFASANLSGNYISFNGIYLDQIPIKQVNDQTKGLFLQIYKKLINKINISDSDTNVDVIREIKTLKNKIDSLVYKTYGLIKEDIEIVESQSK